ncbi:MAG: YCF48-related protein [Deltaproteobacteria bacterium]|nr:YCF48-related protein [Deltaproteobacteria bacterium]
MRLFLLLVASAAITLPAHAQSWTTFPLGTSSTVRHIVEAGSSTIYLVGDNGLVSLSDITHTVWTLENPLTSVDLFSVRRPASSQVWVSGEAGVVHVKLINTWFSRNVPNSLERFVIYSRESGCQNALGNAGSLYQTCDTGMTWDTLNSGVNVSLNHGAGFITSTSWIVGDGGTILKSTDGSQTWVPQNSGTTEDLHYIIEGGSGWVIAVGKGGTILRTQDGGTTWTQSPLPITTNLWSVNLSGQNAAIMLAVGDGGTVLRSVDNGATWCQLNPGTSVNLYGVNMVTNTEYIVAGANGVLRRTTDGGGSCETPMDPPPPAVPALSWWGWALAIAAMTLLAVRPRRVAAE